MKGVNLFCAVTMAVMAAPALSAEAILTPKGLGPVAIGMTPSLAEAALATKLTPREASEKERCWSTWRADGKDSGVSYMVVDGKIARIDIAIGSDGLPPPIDTEEAVGIDSSGETIILKYGPRVIVSGHPLVGNDGRYMRVVPPGGTAGIVFDIRDNKVDSFRAGLVPAIDWPEGCASS
jgi:hypothetical protein